MMFGFGLLLGFFLWLRLLVVFLFMLFLFGLRFLLAFFASFFLLGFWLFVTLFFAFFVLKSNNVVSVSAACANCGMAIMLMANKPLVSHAERDHHCE